MLRNWKLCLLLVTFFCSGKLLAQELCIKGALTGADGTVLAGANISIRKLSGSIANVRNNQTDSAGHYYFCGFDPGKFLLIVSSMGFRPFQDTVVLTGRKSTSVYDIVLQPANTELGEVKVSHTTPVIETENGKLVYHLQNSTLTAGQTALDMLRKIPGISTDQQENILWKGSSGVNVMIDGRMTYLYGNQLSNYLKGLNAEDISKIELITAPSSEFDAAGDAGIINIVLKKNPQQGYAIDLRSGISKAKYWMPNENISANVHTQQVNLYGSFDFNTPHSHWLSQSGNTIRNSTDTLQLRRVNESVYKIYYYTWRAGADWQFLPKHKLSISYHGYLDEYKSSNHSTVNQFKEPGILQSFIRSTNDLNEPYHYDAVHAGYAYTIDSLGKKVTADADYTTYRNYSDGLMRTANFDGAGLSAGEDLLRSHQPGSVQIRSAKVDANLPFSGYALKAGLKYADIRNDNQYRFDSLQNGDFAEVADLSNHFNYSERISAAYVSVGKKLKKTNLNIGLRLEHTDADGHTVKQDASNSWNYTKLFPSISIEQTIADGHKLELSISRRIDRPSYTDLNPVRWYTDQYFYYSGNPELTPELAWVYSAIYNLKAKYIFSASYHHRSNYINRKLAVDDTGKAIRSQSANFGNMEQLDLSAAVPIVLFRFWELRLFTDLSHTTYPISQIFGKKQLSRWSATMSLQQEFTLPYACKAELQTYYFSPGLRGIYQTRSSSFTDFGLKKELLKGKLSLLASLSDIFNSNRYKGISQTDVADYYYNDQPNTRKFTLSLSYHIGGEAVKPDSPQTEEQQRL